MPKRQTPESLRLSQSPEIKQHRSQAMPSVTRTQAAPFYNHPGEDDGVCWKTQVYLHFPLSFQKIPPYSNEEWRLFYQSKQEKLEGFMQNKTAKKVFRLLFASSDSHPDESFTELEQDVFLNSVIDLTNNLIRIVNIPIFKTAVTFLHHRLTQPILTLLYQKATTSYSILPKLHWALICRQTLTPDMLHDLKQIYPIPALHLAMFLSSASLITELKKHGAFAYIKDVQGFAAYFHAVKINRSTEILQAFALNEYELNQTNNGLSLLEIATRNRNLEMIHFLLNAGAKIENATKEQRITPLHLAAKRGYVDVVKLMLSKEINPDLKGYNNKSPIYYATKKGHDAVVKCLLDAGAWVNQGMGEEEITPLHLAIEHQQVNVVACLLQNGANPHKPNHLGWGALHLACLAGNYSIVQLLLNAPMHADTTFSPLGHTALHLTAEQDNLEIFKLLIQHRANPEKENDHSFNALHIAAHFGQLEIARFILEIAPQLINVVTRTHFISPLYLAAENGHLELVNLFLQKGAEPNWVSRTGYTPLHIAARKGFLAIVNRLIDASANINQIIPEGQLTPLYLAAEKGYVDVVDRLLREGADMQLTNNADFNPVHIAVINGHLAVLERLLQENVNINKPGDQGYTPLHCAVHSGDLNVVKCIVQNGANLNVFDDEDRCPLYLAAHLQLLDIFVFLFANEQYKQKNRINLLREVIRENNNTAIDTCFAYGLYIEQTHIHGWLNTELKNRVEMNKQSREGSLLLKTAYLLEKALKLHPIELIDKLPTLKIMPIGYGIDGVCYLSKAIDGDPDALKWISTYDCYYSGAVQNWITQAGPKPEIFCLAVQLVTQRTPEAIKFPATTLKALFSNPHTFAQLALNIDTVVLRNWLEIMTDAPEMSLFKSVCQSMSHYLLVEEMKKLRSQKADDDLIEQVSPPERHQKLITSFFRPIVQEQENDDWESSPLSALSQ
ncbi:ankyrin repeat domain-containing protein [Legionella worsleiensis]|uniref:Ankyrin repeat protein n=1 Tax=Legionella worsleiensis TaxID=45076 RepID=A0A0W1AH87_9GAMM|nr:ankyrin repeat domain-containing protein [Legionella worsleiensis]KTD80690.1 Ankyrin repeat protein [Legionella worsleiensis]STY32732.1 Ankyrin repeat protein [Legionella worsleiensis]